MIWNILKIVVMIVQVNLLDILPMDIIFIVCRRKLVMRSKQDTWRLNEDVREAIGRKIICTN